MKIYTRTGDSGETGLFDGTRVSKADSRVDAYGEVDELNAWLGLARTPGRLSRKLEEMVQHIQRDLFALGARLADPRHKIAERVTKAQVHSDDVTRLERWIDELDAALPPLRKFILPGGSRQGATLHIARTVCRRAERAVVGIGGDPELIVYLNRLSDLLFVMARFENNNAGIPESEW